MSNMKMEALIADTAAKAHLESEAIAKDAFAALIAITEPLKERIEALEREVEHLAAGERLSSLTRS